MTRTYLAYHFPRLVAPAEPGQASESVHLGHLRQLASGRIV